MVMYFYGMIILSALVLSACTQNDLLQNGAVSTPDNQVATERPFPTDSPISIEGEAVCLPHVNPKETTTEECVFGVKSEDGTYYALRLAQYTPAEFQLGKIYKVDGYFKSESSAEYPIKGLIKTTTLQ